jgi:hypothetical protein
VPGGRFGKIGCRPPFRAGEEAQAIRECDVTMGCGSALRLFTFEGFLRLRRLRHRAGMIVN